MFREKEICNAIRTAYLYLFPDKKERNKGALQIEHGTCGAVCPLSWGKCPCLPDRGITMSIP